MDNDVVSSMLAISGIIGIFEILFFLAIIIISAIAYWKLFKKAGKNGWEALIPFYSVWVLIEIAGLNWWYFLISIFAWFTIFGGLASLFVNFLIFYNLAKKTGKNEILYGILGIFFGGILVMILGFSKNVTFDNTVVVSPNGPFGKGKTDKTNNTNSTTNDVNNTVNNTVNDTVNDVNNTVNDVNTTINTVNTVNNTATTTTKVCSNCGQAIRENTNFCTNCGQKVE